MKKENYDFMYFLKRTKSGRYSIGKQIVFQDGENTEENLFKNLVIINQDNLEIEKIGNEYLSIISLEEKDRMKNGENGYSKEEILSKLKSKFFENYKISINKKKEIEDLEEIELELDCVLDSNMERELRTDLGFDKETLDKVLDFKYRMFEKGNLKEERIFINDFEEFVHKFFIKKVEENEILKGIFEYEMNELEKEKYEKTILSLDFLELHGGYEDSKILDGSLEVIKENEEYSYNGESINVSGEFFKNIVNGTNQAVGYDIRKQTSKEGYKSSSIRGPICTIILLNLMKIGKETRSLIFKRILLDENISFLKIEGIEGLIGSNKIIRIGGKNHRIGAFCYYSNFIRNHLPLNLFPITDVEIGDVQYVKTLRINGEELKKKLIDFYRKVDMYEEAEDYIKRKERGELSLFESFTGIFNKKEEKYNEILYETYKENKENRIIEKFSELKENEKEILLKSL